MKQQTTIIFYDSTDETFARVRLYTHTHTCAKAMADLICPALSARSKCCSAASSRPSLNSICASSQSASALFRAAAARRLRSGVSASSLEYICRISLHICFYPITIDGYVSWKAIIQQASMCARTHREPRVAMATGSLVSAACCRYCRAT